MHYSALFLDFYGTLVAEDDPVIEAICAQAGANRQAFGLRWSTLFAQLCAESHGATFQTQRAIELQSLELAMQEAGVDGDPLAMSQALYDYWQAPEPFPESTSFLEHCPIPICIVSNIDMQDIQLAAQSCGWRFERLITSEQVRSYKPRPEIFHAALETMDIRPEQALHVGDSLSSDIRGASAVGIDTVWLNRKGRPFRDKQLEPTYEIQNLEQLIPILIR
ncbi:HAD family hydrolase [Cerasicoccus frondis]|uniref:HAD family hydrolase n=1 Tax=Cerasicoccus frondis TaxID=490090 RepID=UPI0028528461|nr:HAD family hydrolase [Cerasicoccus frondis]